MDLYTSFNEEEAEEGSCNWAIKAVSPRFSRFSLSSLSPSFDDNVVSSRYHFIAHSQAERERKKSFVFKEKRKRKTDFSRQRKWWDRVDRNSFSLDHPLYNSASAMAVGVPSSPISTLAKQTYCCEGTMDGTRGVLSRFSIKFFQRKLLCNHLW